MGVHGHVRAPLHEGLLLFCEAACEDTRPQHVAHCCNAAAGRCLAQGEAADQRAEHGVNELLQVRLEHLTTVAKISAVPMFII